MREVAYLLNRFPQITDTFIIREISALQKEGMNTRIISVWRPAPKEADNRLMHEWRQQISFLLPRPSLSFILASLFISIRSPSRTLSTIWLAIRTARPGISGLIKQMFYFGEAILAAGVCHKDKIAHLHNHFGDHSAIVTMLAAKLCEIPYSISFHGPHVFFDGPLAKIDEKVSRASFVRCISYFCRSQVILFSQITDLSTLKIVHCGLNIQDYGFRLPREQVKYIYCAARLAPEKGFQFLIQALKILVKENMKLSFA